MKIPKKICWLLTLGHWWKYYPGEKRYMRCRLCGQMPKRGMWETLRRIKRLKRNFGLAWVREFCIAVPFERMKK